MLLKWTVKEFAAFRNSGNVTGEFLVDWISKNADL
jgi:hypothetical protein